MLFFEIIEGRFVKASGLISEQGADTSFLRVQDLFLSFSETSLSSQENDS
jgi:hypothetical protein